MGKKSVHSSDSGDEGASNLMSSSASAAAASLVQSNNSFQAAVEPVKRFAQDSYRLVKRCTKPDAKEFKKITIATTVGFFVMGCLGFFVKLVHIPINNILVGQ